MRNQSERVQVGEHWVYGVHAVRSLLQRNASQVLSVYVQPATKSFAELEALFAQHALEVVHVSREQLDKWVEGVHQGVAAKIRPLEPCSEAELLRLLEGLHEPPLLLVLDGVTDPHNLGACLRSADASGAHAVIIPKDKSASLSATVRKVACGAAEVVPVVAVTNLARTLRRLQEQGLWLYGTAADASQELYDVDFKGGSAIIMGNEGKGMRRLTRDTCDVLMSLPLHGTVSSINVSVAAGVCLFEARRQRLKYK